MEKYVVYVDDNYHQGDESERYKLGEYDTREAALEACKKKVDEYFEKLESGKYSFNEIWDGYLLYGEDPYIASDNDEERFSAWEYAKQRCREYAA